MNDKNQIQKELWDLMSEDEKKTFENLKKDFEDKRFVTSKILNKTFVPKWLSDLELRFSEVPELLSEEIGASGDVDQKDEYIEALYGVDEEHESYGRYCQLFWNQRRFAKMISYEKKMTDKYFKNEQDCSDED